MLDLTIYLRFVANMDREITTLQKITVVTRHMNNWMLYGAFEVLQVQRECKIRFVV